MRHPRPLTLLLTTALLVAAAPAQADQRDPRLEPLFNQLAAARTPQESAAAIALIDPLWISSGSDTVDLLMSRAAQAGDADDIDTAMKLYGMVSEMKPEYAEVWFMRGLLFASMDSQQEAATALSRAIALEPRHFRAHALLGRLADLAGNRAAALASYRAALRINPVMPDISRRVGQLSLELEKRKPD